ncbi:cobalt-precorrin-6A reductase [Granulosicoccus antarcticus]|uniref:Precorrin-6A reductase n=1 Tax=Granulosicoccus antarcticus IMCC3135 TaxID=1192854 RepID=A0A2Z2NW29_9GAMM|nr:cobalt-precorrin-6A reductase [Granulosicoccus antarcticus]ASJ71887.1 Precorrin-6A reductase [Granulosicoccus antarcticus IMCC3135]
MTSVLLLGGTTEASDMAHAMAHAMAYQGINAWFSYAGRTRAPKAQPIPTRIGGFGGVEGMVDWLQQHDISHVIDATHPFAAGISANALQACALTGVDLCSFERAAWQAGGADNWQYVCDIDAAVDALPQVASNIFLAIGKQHIKAFTRQAQHHYLLRLVDQPEEAPPLPFASYVVDRGPFTVEQDLAMLREHAIDIIVCKNSGGSGAVAKLVAARHLQLPVVMINRPIQQACTRCHSVDEVLDWLAHATLRGV